MMNQEISEGQTMQTHQGKNSFLDTIIKILIILLLLGGVLLLGLFLKQNLDSQKQAQRLATPQTQQSTNTIRTPAPTITSQTHTLTTALTQQAPQSSSVSNESDKKIYTEEDMQEIMQMLIDQIQQMDNASQKEVNDHPKVPKDQQKSSTQNSTATLLSSLQAVPADSIQSDNTPVETITDVEAQKIKAKNSQTHNSDYNKVLIHNQTYSQAHIDDLSSQIGGLINELTQKNKTKAEDNYTSSIKKEVSVRQSAMRVVVVRQGDSLSKIALRAYGSVNAYRKILQANRDLIKNPNHIYVGQRLRIPD